MAGPNNLTTTANAAIAATIPKKVAIAAPPPLANCVAASARSLNPAAANTTAPPTIINAAPNLR